MCRDIAWHDLAFFNADLYEGMRRMMVDTETGKKDSEEFVATYCCYFEVSKGLLRKKNKVFCKKKKNTKKE